MSRIKLPGSKEILALAEVRADFCVSIYLETSPLKLNADACRIELRNMMRDAKKYLEDVGYGKRSVQALVDNLEEIAGDDAFCEHQANSLALFATPEMSRVYYLANKLPTKMEISDRFYLKPLMRAVTFRHTAFVLALSENQVRVITLTPTEDADEVSIPGMPKDAMKALGLSSMTAAKGGPLERKDDRKSRLARYARQVDDALRPLISGCDIPLVLVAAEPMASIFRTVSSACIVPETVFTNPEALSVKELGEAARPALDAFYADQIHELGHLFETRAGENRVATDLTDIARAATFGMVSLALVDFETNTTGHIDADGALTRSNAPGSYGVIDEIVKRTLENGGHVVAVRKEDMVGDTGVAVILRYPLSA